MAGVIVQVIVQSMEAIPLWI